MISLSRRTSDCSTPAMPHPSTAAASRSVPSGSSNTAWRTFCAIVYIFQSCTSGERQTFSMLRPFFSLAAMVPVRVWS